MGYEASCTLTTGGRSFAGNARLEHKNLVFRGETRLAIRLDQIHEVHSRGGCLFVTFGEQRAVFELGKDAERWAARIANPPSRLAKLGVKPGMRIALSNLEDDELIAEIRQAGAVLENARGKGLDLIFFGAARPQDLAKLAGLVSRLAPAGAIWLVREKGNGARVTETESMAAGKQAGLVDVKVVSFSETQSAEKYVIPLARRARASRSPSAPARTHRSSSSPGRR